MKVLLVLAVCLAWSLVEGEVDIVFDSFLKAYGKQYDSDMDYQYRRAVFHNNLQIANSLAEKDERAKYGVTKFMDMTQDEFRKYYLIPEHHFQNNKDKPYFEIPDSPIIDTIPDAFDWNDKGAVTPVYDQGQCGSCWAFSATEAIESQWYLAHHPLTSLSPQQIVDCDKGRGDEGCNGGDTPTAYEYVISAGGMETETAYPYTGEDDTCAFKTNSVVAKISNWTYVSTTKNETEMQVKLLANGPISICVDAEIWQFYVGGVISALCGTTLDHCVLLTGYDDKYVNILGETVQIWKIRNSWGADWGESGYVYVERNYDLCGVADEPTLPIV
eukprot:TRINITY_DN2202_c0_g1_i1.p1 TRINITY_DN2202_c0_g1~~TRINITY_DN2202_c0_g1_i1.p1  ORF type:complete len:330 (+),score=66.00 TRINITY_DN2202_c0_g1_i1:2-991(+)